MAVYDFSGGLGLLGQGIDSLGASLKDAWKTQQSQSLANALATGDWSAAMQAAAQMGDANTVLKLRQLQQNAGSDTDLTNLTKQLLSGGTTGATAPTPAAGGVAGYNPATTEAKIRAKAQELNIDPDIAVSVARTEGLTGYQGDKDAAGNYTSFGPFQLHYAGQGGGMGSPGLGDAFTKATGLDARDPRTLDAQIDFALRQAKQGGWGPWHGWKGDKWAGIGATTAGSQAAAPVAASPTINTPLPQTAIAAAPPAAAAAPPVPLPPQRPPALDQTPPPPQLVQAPLPPVRPPGLGGTLPAVPTAAAGSDAAVASFLSSHVGPQAAVKILQAPPNTPMSQLVPPGTVPADDMAKTSSQFVDEARQALASGMGPGTPAGLGSSLAPPVQVASAAGMPTPDTRGPPSSIPPAAGFGNEPPIASPRQVASIPPPAGFDVAAAAPSPAVAAGAPANVPPEAVGAAAGDVASSVQQGALAALQGAPGAPVPSAIADVASRLAPGAPAAAAGAAPAAAVPAAPTAVGGAPAATGAAPVIASPANPDPPVMIGGKPWTRAQASADDSPDSPSVADVAKAQGVSGEIDQKASADDVTAGLQSGELKFGGAAAAAGETPTPAKIAPTPAAAKAGDPTVSAAATAAPAVAQSLARTRPGSDQRQLLLALMARAAAGSSNPQGNLKFVEMLQGIEKQHQEQFEKTKRILSPQQAAAAGLPDLGPTGVYQADAFGNVTKVEGQKAPERVLTPAEVTAAGLDPATGPGRIWVRTAEGKLESKDANVDTASSFAPLTEAQQKQFPGAVAIQKGGKEDGKPYYPPAAVEKSPEQMYQARLPIAQRLGLQPGTPEFNSYMTEGKLPKVELTKPQQDMVDKSNQALAAIDENIATVQNAIEQARAGKMNFGLLGRTAQALSVLPGLGSERAANTAALDADIQNTILGNLKSIFGGQVRVSEMNRAMGLKPSTSQSQAEFLAKAEDYVTHLKNLRAQEQARNAKMASGSYWLKGTPAAPQTLGAPEPVAPGTQRGQGAQRTSPQPQYQEGQTATGPGGKKLIFRGGQWQDM